MIYHLDVLVHNLKKVASDMQPLHTGVINNAKVIDEQ